jgi:hypothetical protein
MKQSWIQSRGIRPYNSKMIYKSSTYLLSTNCILMTREISLCSDNTRFLQLEKQWESYKVPIIDTYIKATKNSYTAIHIC